ncbi:MAG: hypothetical protein CM1200mP9_08510 [Gammaproteobacteria bacterium]|nr:MAG: hypothetical protein CM1200mP9_08510 [Gammaproteobacteria bacterium]
MPGQARAAEETGFDYVTCGELSHDLMLTMTLAATSTGSYRSADVGNDRISAKPPWS